MHTKPGAFEHTWLSALFPHLQNGDVDMISLPFTKSKKWLLKMSST